MSTTLATDTTTIDGAAAADPNVLTVEATSSLVPGTATEVSVRTPGHRFTIDEPPALGGTDKGANPVEHLFAALGGCTVISYQVWAQKLGLTIDTLDVAVRGDLDLRGFLGLDDTVRPGFPQIHLDITLAGPASQDDYRRLADEVEKHCPVLDNLAAGATVHRTLDLTTTSA